MGRSVLAGSLVRGQPDFYFPIGTFNRVNDLQSTDVTIKLFVNNQVLSWTLLDGSAIPDSSISAGSVYFNQILSSPGFYSVRFYPDRVGFWRLSITAGSFESLLEFDVNPAAPQSPGLTATFT